MPTPKWPALAALALAAGVVAVVSLRSQPALEPPPSAPPSVKQPEMRPGGKAPAAEEKKPARRFGLAEPLPRTPGAIRLATYNLENLFDDHDDPALSGDVDDAKMTKPEPHRRALADAIRKVDADILALQEIESLQALTWFRDNHLSGLGYDHIVSIDTGDPRGIECAVLSRFPVSNPVTWKELPLGGTHPEKDGDRPNALAGQPITFKRSPLRVTVEVPADRIPPVALGPAHTGPAKPYALTLFVVHMKAGNADYWRQREAAKIVELVKEFEKDNAGANIIVLGDCNAQFRDRPIQIMTDGGLKEVFVNRSSRDAATTTHSSGRKIDQILMNAGALGEFVPESRFVLGTMDRAEGADWRTTPPPEGWASDHYPVVVDLIPVENGGTALQSRPSATGLETGPTKSTTDNPSTTPGGAAPRTPAKAPN